jgi:hypothetical protein
MTTDTQTKKKAACTFVRLDTLNGRLSKEWLLFIYGATPAMARELADTLFPKELTPKICKAAGVKSGERYNIHYITTTAQLTEEEVAEYGDGPGVIVIHVDVIDR